MSFLRAASFETLATLASQDEEPHAERTKCASRSTAAGRSTLAQELRVFLRARSHLLPFGGAQRHLADGIIAAEAIHFRKLAIARRRRILLHDLSLPLDLGKIGIA